MYRCILVLGVSTSFIVICMLICSNYIYRVTDNGYEACAWPEIIVLVISNWYFGKYPIDSNFGSDSVRTK